MSSSGIPLSQIFIFSKAICFKKKCPSRRGGDDFFWDKSLFFKKCPLRRGGQISQHNLTAVPNVKFSHFFRLLSR